MCSKAYVFVFVHSLSPISLTLYQVDILIWAIVDKRLGTNLHIWCNGPRSIYQYSYMAPRLSGQTSIFGVVFFVSKSPLGIERQKKLEKFAILTRKPRSHARILIYRTWPIGESLFTIFASLA